MGSNNEIASQLKLEDIKQHYSFYKQGLHTPVLGQYDLFQSKIKKQVHIARTRSDFAYSPQDNSRLSMLKDRPKISTQNLALLCHVEEESSFCGSSRQLVCYSQFYTRNLSSQMKIKKQIREMFYWEDVDKIAHQVIKVLASLHQTGVAHQTLQPSNIMFTNQSQLIILDSYSMTGLSNYKLGYLSKQANYLSPKQCEALDSMVLQAKDDKLKSDVFAFGMTMLQTCTLIPIQNYYLKNYPNQVEINNQLQNLRRLGYPIQLIDRIALALKFQQRQRISSKELLQLWENKKKPSYFLQ